MSGLSYLFQPRNAEEILEAFELARKSGRAVALRGAGNSYGDAAILDDGIVLDLTAMDRVLEFDPEAGIIKMEPGVTIQKLWQTIIPHGWWPPVVSGTMFTTAGGCAAMNIHGKNNYKVGPYGEHIVEFELLTPGGKLIRCSPSKDPNLFHAAISGFGMLGCFVSITLRLKKIYSGLLAVEAFSAGGFRAMEDEFEYRTDHADYLVGWIDCVAGGRRLGRGVVHSARYLEPGEDPRPSDTLTIASQQLPSKLFGAVPKNMLHMFMRPFVNNLGVRAVNAAKMQSQRVQPRSSIHYQSHGGFAFLLDYVPNWKKAYGSGGLIQYQSFIPKEAAAEVFTALLKKTQAAGLPPYLGVFKKHRPDGFLLSHAVDGYSLALDFRVTTRNRVKLWALCRQLDELVLDAGGRFYFAKDATLSRQAVNRFLDAESLKKFVALKRKHDPENLLQTSLSRRLFDDFHE